MAEDVLAAIVARKRIDVAERLRGVGLSDLRARAAPTRNSLAVLARSGARFVMEVKRVSPSEGALRPGVDPAAMARAYKGAADAISVLTDTAYFGGSLADLAAVRAVYDGPLLAKDFIVDVRQVAEARLHGADAVLAMLSVLDDDGAAAVMAEARTLGMDVLVEAHDDAEVRRAVALGAEMIGINNRDLKTLTVDLNVTERLAALVPPDRLVVAESGIRNRADVARLSGHADAFLVGSALMRATDPRAAARALAFGPVKVCGLTQLGDIETAADAGATYAGLVMVPGTPRAVTPMEADRLAASARAKGLAVVGVFRDEKPNLVAQEAESLALAAVQLHGDEGEDYIAALRVSLPPGCEIWAASAVGETIAVRSNADRILFDTAVDGRSGGTGRTFDWSRIAGRHEVKAGLLAGGLNPGNVRAAAKLGAFALDVGSGVEAEPGRKDADKLSAFFEALRIPARGEPA